MEVTLSSPDEILRPQWSSNPLESVPATRYIAYTRWGPLIRGGRARTCLDSRRTAHLRVVACVLFVRVARRTPVHGTGSRYHCLALTGGYLRRIS